MFTSTFIDWFRSLKSHLFCCYTGLSVDAMMLRVKAKELSTDPEFKPSLGLYSNWKRRHSMSMRTKTSLAQHLPADMKNKVVDFHRFILRSRQCWGYDLSHILNMDGTPMRFELPATRTLEFTESRTVPVLSCGADKRSFTVALTVKANGEKTATESHLQRCSTAEHQHAT